MTSQDVEVPTRWGSLEIRARIGGGTFGEVFRAYDPSLQREVALKLVRVDEPERPRASADLYLEEARRLARIRHPNVLAIHGIETHDGRMGLWTDLLHGLTLAEMFEQEEWLSEQEILRIGIQLCRALQAIHEAGLIHGDVKGANVFSEPNGHVVLMDFGAGRRVPVGGTDRVESEGPLFGTPIVLAPEVLEGASPTAAADLYSLGVLLYRGAAGRYPVAASSIFDLVLEHRQGKRIRLGEIRPDLPDVLTRAVDRALARDPAERFESAAELETSLAIVLDRENQTLLESWVSDLPNGAPEESTRFLGRTRELARVQELLDRGECVTLVGPGGAGKTRLALEVARRFARRYSDGVRWIDLVRVLDSADFLASVAGQLDVRARPQQSENEALLEFLRNRSTLLILDNAEHVLVSARSWIAEVLHACPRVNFLTTSREPLGFDEEHPLDIGPMEIPVERDTAGDKQAGDRIAELSSCDSIRLFLDRACLTQRSFRPGPSHLDAVARIVRLIDGLPLAIELAAARVVSMGVEEIASRLERSTALLAEPDRPTPRHQTMSRTLEWSWSLLSEAEQVLLHRLSVFRSGATLASIEHVTADPFGALEGPCVPPPEQLTPRDETPAVIQSPPDPRIEGEEVFLLLDGLVRRSLVRLERGRYRLYEVVRQFAAEKLRTSPDATAVERRFLRHFVLLAIEAYRRFYGADQERWFSLVSEESTNFEAALGIALRPEHEADAGLRLAASLGLYWARLGLFSTGLSHLQAQLNRDGSQEPSVHRADALNWAGNLATAMANYALAVSFHEEGMAIQRARQFPPGIGNALAGLGDAFSRMGETARARACYEENIAIQRSAGLPIQLSAALTKLAVLCESHRDLDQASALYEESLALNRSRGDYSAIALSLTGLGKVSLLRGEHDRALECFAEALALRRRTGDRAFMATTLNYLAHTHTVSGRLQDALPHLREAIRIQEGIRKPMGLFDCLYVLSFHAEKSGRASESLTLFSAAYAIRESTGEIIATVERKRFEERAQELRAALAEHESRQAWVSGQCMTIEDALAFGFAYLERAR